MAVASLPGLREVPAACGNAATPVARRVPWHPAGRLGQDLAGGHRCSQLASRSSRKPWTSASGRGGQPGTYTSTGMIWSTPLVTEYESQYGPPQLAHAPIEITYFGSGICSYSRWTA